MSEGMELSIGEEQFHIQRLCADDLPQLLDMTAQEGWIYSTENFLPFMDSQSSPYIGVFTQKHELIAHCAAFAVTKTCGYIGAFITKDKYRGKGIGRNLLSHVLKMLGNRNIFLESEFERRYVEMYTRRGFLETELVLWKTSFKINTSIISSEESEKQVKIQQLHATDPELKARVEVYRRRLCETDNFAQLFQCLQTKKITTLAALDLSNMVVGYAAFHAQDNGEITVVEVRGFYADNQTIAKAILTRFLSQYKTSEKKLELSLSYVGQNHENVAGLFQEMECVATTNKEYGVRMVRCMDGKTLEQCATDINIDWNKVFSFTQAWSDII